MGAFLRLIPGAAPRRASDRSEDGAAGDAVPRRVRRHGSRIWSRRRAIPRALPTLRVKLAATCAVSVILGFAVFAAWERTGTDLEAGPHALGPDFPDPPGGAADGPSSDVELALRSGTPAPFAESGAADPESAPTRPLPQTAADSALETLPDRLGSRAGPESPGAEPTPIAPASGSGTLTAAIPAENARSDPAVNAPRRSGLSAAGLGGSADRPERPDPGAEATAPAVPEEIEPDLPPRDAATGDAISSGAESVADSATERSTPGEAADPPNAPPVLVFGIPLATVEGGLDGPVPDPASLSAGDPVASASGQLAEPTAYTAYGPHWRGPAADAARPRAPAPDPSSSTPIPVEPSAGEPVRAAAPADALPSSASSLPANGPKEERTPLAALFEWFFRSDPPPAPEEVNPAADADAEPEPTAIAATPPSTVADPAEAGRTREAPIAEAATPLEGDRIEPDAAGPVVMRRRVTVAEGDSLHSILGAMAIPAPAATRAIDLLSPEFEPMRMKAGDSVVVVVQTADGATTVEALSISRPESDAPRWHWTSGLHPLEETIAPEIAAAAGEQPVEGDSVAASIGEAASGEAGDDPTPLIRHTVTVQSGDSLLGLLRANEVSAADALGAVSRIEPAYDPSRLQIGDRISFVIDSPARSEEDEARSRLLELRIEPRRSAGASHLWSSGESLDGRQVLDIVDGIAGLEPPDLAPAQLELVEGRIVASFYTSAVRAGLAPAEIHKLVQILSSTVDFRRDIKSGDRFEALLRRRPGGSSEVQYVALRNGSASHSYYRADFADGTTGFFDATGRSSRNLLSWEPIPGAPVTSKFGYRIHPIQGHRHLHRGIDFKARTGTEIRAAGDGVVIVVGRRGGYGKTIRIRHNGSFVTAYAHLHGYAAGIRTGTRVKRGEVIGYVGSTGLSTGPHLHFEVLEDGKAIDPLELKKLPAPTLSGEVLTAFQESRRSLDQQLDRLRTNRLASVD